MTHYFVRRHRLLVIALGLLMGIQLNAQNSDDAKDVTSTFFIKNAFVVESPGVVLSNTSILVKDGIIQRVGKDLQIPFDAQVINADSMYVYAAFIDACSHSGIATEEKKDQPRIKDPGNPPKKLAGITPQGTVRDAIGDKLDKSMDQMRELGFGFIHVVPRGRMLPGQGSILSTGGNSVESMMIKENVSQFAQFKPASRMFPSTTIGVMSQFRDLYKNAELSNSYMKSYSLQPNGLQRPEHSIELASLFPVVQKKMPVFFYTPKVLDVNRALILQKELGFKMVLTGMRQAWPLVDEIAEGGHTVVLSLHLPEELEESKKEKKEEDDSMEEEAKTDSTTVTLEEEGDIELKRLKEKKKESYEAFVGQAAFFEEKGIPFSFSSLDTKSKEIKPNIMRMIEAGLSEKGALAALTTQPAMLLGIDKLAGTVEKGKIANLIITNKSYFDKDANIKFLLTDGQFKEFKEKKKKKKGSGKKAKVNGKWKYKVSIPENEQTGTMVIKETGGNIEIKINNDENPLESIEGSNVQLVDNNLTFDIELEGVSYNIDIKFEGSDFEGTVSAGPMGSIPMEGSLIDGPE